MPTKSKSSNPDAHVLTLVRVWDHCRRANPEKPDLEIGRSLGMVKRRSNNPDYYRYHDFDLTNDGKTARAASQLIAAFAISNDHLMSITVGNGRDILEPCYARLKAVQKRRDKAALEHLRDVLFKALENPRSQKKWRDVLRHQFAAFDAIESAES